MSEMKSLKREISNREISNRDTPKNTVNKFDRLKNQITAPIPEITIQAKELQVLIKNLYKRLEKGGGEGSEGQLVEKPANVIKPSHFIAPHHMDNLDKLRNRKQNQITASQN